MSSMSNPNVELLRRAWAAFDQFDFEAFGASLAEDWREHDSGGNVVSTREQERQTMELQPPHSRTGTPRSTGSLPTPSWSPAAAPSPRLTRARTLTPRPQAKWLVTHVMMFSRVERGRLAETWAMSEGANLYEQITGRPAPEQPETGRGGR
jgi:hypothetical protein